MHNKSEVIFMICVILFVICCFLIPIILYAISQDSINVKATGLDIDVDNCPLQVIKTIILTYVRFSYYIL